ncbi:hypothetical protein L6452_41928 [Arctium lappa]|uniref:Uncharacterized protein n=1 Tax=Arctium lappa TaxID=4217 RepID=A0ACB8XHM0_ARCLA|nr:hypothetical protein L6452_41928 [Arctium lappa]
MKHLLYHIILSICINIEIHNLSFIDFSCESLMTLSHIALNRICYILHGRSAQSNLPHSSQSICSIEATTFFR